MSMANENPTSVGCLSLDRIWAMAFQPESWSYEEGEHVLMCLRCRRRLNKATEALAAQNRYADGLVVLGERAETRACRAVGELQYGLACDSGPVRDRGYIEYHFEDDKLKAAVTREDDGGCLLHVEHGGRKPGDLVLAVGKPSDESHAVWARWLVLRPGYNDQAIATIGIDEVAQGENYQLYLDVVATPPPESVEQLRQSFAAVQMDDPEAVPFWQDWARVTLAAGVIDDSLRQVLAEIRDAKPMETRGDHRAELSSVRSTPVTTCAGTLLRSAG
jgi:hypothetical protein